MTTQEIARERRSQLKRWAKDEFRRENLTHSLTSGVLIFVMEVLMVISFAAMVFSGELAGMVSYGIGMIILGDALLCLVVVITSSYPGSIALAQDAPSAILAAAVTATLTAMQAGVSLETKFATVLIMIVATSLATGLAFILLGYFKLGGLARFLPYPVLGGFLAGTGWLILSGGLGVMTNLPFGLEALAPGMWLRWVPGLALGVVLVILMNRSQNVFILPVAVIISTGLFYLATWLRGISLAYIFSRGWLLGPFPEGNQWQFPLSPTLLSQVDWSALPGLAGTAGLMIFVSGVALLLNANSLELITRRDIDLNHELMSAGLGNLASGLVGGMVGYQAVSLSALNHRLSGGKRLSGLVVGTALIAAAFLGANVFAYLPRFVLGGLLVYLGLSLLVEWVYKAWLIFPRTDFVVVLLILVAIAVYGFLVGLAVGMAATIFLFVVGYSRVSVVKNALHGTAYRSLVSRSHFQYKCLDALRQQIYILQLQGFVFFGSANNLYERFCERIKDKTLPPVKFMVLDCTRVTGLDSTGLLSFSKMAQTAQENGGELVVIGLNDEASSQFRSAGLIEEPGSLRFFFDLDRGIEWCEDQLIVTSGLDQGECNDLFIYLNEIEPEPVELERLLKHLKRVEAPAGEVIIQQGNESGLIYFLEKGQVTAQLEHPGRPPMRLETMQAGRIFGELGVYLSQPRAATVKTDQDSVLYILSKEDLEAIQITDPAVAAVLHRIVLHMMSERVMQLTRALDALQR